jgi:hypothetical protein
MDCMARPMIPSDRDGRPRTSTDRGCRKRPSTVTGRAGTKHLWRAASASTRFLMLVLALAGCAIASPPAGRPTAEGPTWPPQGSSWVIAERNTGSFGSGARQLTITALGDQTWEGKVLKAFSDGAVTTYLDAQGSLIARVRGAVLLESWEPSFKTFKWPLFVGEWWPNRFRYRNGERGLTFDNVEYDAQVEAAEDVATPAGTFQAFRLVFGNPYAATVLWWSADLGIFVKSRDERFPLNPFGTGTRETDLVSYNLKR